jgi:hypothetical protein
MVIDRRSGLPRATQQVGATKRPTRNPTRRRGLVAGGPQRGRAGRPAGAQTRGHCRGLAADPGQRDRPVDNPGAEGLRGDLDRASFEQRCQLVELLIDRVGDDDGKVEIRYVIPTGRPSKTCPACACSAQWASRSTPRRGSVTRSTSAADAARWSTLVVGRDGDDHDHAAA